MKKKEKKHKEKDFFKNKSSKKLEQWEFVRVSTRFLEYK